MPNVDTSNFRESLYNCSNLCRFVSHLLSSTISSPDCRLENPTISLMLDLLIGSVNLPFSISSIALAIWTSPYKYMSRIKSSVYSFEPMTFIIVTFSIAIRKTFSLFLKLMNQKRFRLILTHMVSFAFYNRNNIVYFILDEANKSDCLAYPRIVR